MVQIHNQFSEHVEFLGDIWLKSRLCAAVSASSGVGRALDFTSLFSSSSLADTASWTNSVRKGQFSF